MTESTTLFVNISKFLPTLDVCGEVLDQRHGAVQPEFAAHVL